jgi:hypothetical protein
MTTRTDGTTYGFNSTADVLNPAMKFNTGEMATIFTIWDAGGIDTLDLSGFYTPSVIDLREGGYSSAGGFGAYSAEAAALRSTIDTTMSKDEFLKYIDAANSAAGLGARGAVYDLYFGGREGANDGVPWNEITNSVGSYLLQQNIGIAYGAVIEKAIGGHGADRINGNQADNFFTGNGGADTFIIADYSGTLPDPKLGTRTFTDTSTDTIMDFTAEDTLDLTEFGNVSAGDVLWNGTTNKLLINTDDDAEYEVTVVIHGTFNPTEDILFG